MANEVRIKLTSEQKAKIKEATGKEMTELRVESVGGNPAFSPVASKTSARISSKAAARAQVSARNVARAGKLSARTAARDVSARNAGRAGKVSARNALSAKTSMRADDLEG